MVITGLPLVNIQERREEELNKMVHIFLIAKQQQKPFKWTKCVFLENAYFTVIINAYFW